MTPYHRSWHLTPIAYTLPRGNLCRYYCTVCPIPRGAVGVIALRGERAHLVRCANCGTPIVNHADPETTAWPY